MRVLATPAMIGAHDAAVALVAGGFGYAEPPVFGQVVEEPDDAEVVADVGADAELGPEGDDDALRIRQESIDEKGDESCK